MEAHDFLLQAQLFLGMARNYELRGLKNCAQVSRELAQEYLDFYEESLREDSAQEDKKVGTYV